jgi:hypothetical protein
VVVIRGCWSGLCGKYLQANRLPPFDLVHPSLFFASQEKEITRGES